jgi:hypothetical protein
MAAPSPRKKSYDSITEHDVEVMTIVYEQVVAQVKLGKDGTLKPLEVAMLSLANHHDNQPYRDTVSSSTYRFSFSDSEFVVTIDEAVVAS